MTTSPTWIESAIAYFASRRILLRSLQIGTLLIVGPAFLAVGAMPTDGVTLRRLLLAVIAFVFILIAGFMANDLADREVDKVAHPERALASGAAKPVHIQALFVLSVLAALVTAAALSIEALMFLSIQGAWGSLVFWVLKKKVKIPGSSLVFSCTLSASMPILSFVAVVDHWTGWHYVMLALISGLIFFADLASDLAGAIHDQDGERGIIANLPAVIGDRPAAILSLILFCVAGGFGLVLFWVAELSLVFLLGTGVAFVAVLLLYRQLLQGGDRGKAMEVFRQAWFYFVIGTNAAIVLDRVVHSALQALVT
jgi:4-hydroxybenzoate polyprenyltransferase